MIKRTTPVDQLVGTRIRERRRAVNMSQTELARKIGVTFQQVQKYENGVNRISAGRLSAIAQALGVPMTFFFGEAPPTEPSAAGEAIEAALREASTVALVRAYAAIPDASTRRSFLQLVRTVAGESPEQPDEGEAEPESAARDVIVASAPALRP